MNHTIKVATSDVKKFTIIGKLIFVDTTNKPEPGMLSYLSGCIEELGICTEEYDVYKVKSGTQLTYKGFQLKPIIISEEEMIHQDDHYYDSKNKTIGVAGGLFSNDDVQKFGHKRYYKILVLPENFSKNTLEEIVNGELIEKKYVLVSTNLEGYYNRGKEVKWHQITFNSENFATIKKIEKIKKFSEEEVIEILVTMKLNWDNVSEAQTLYPEKLYNRVKEDTINWFKNLKFS